MKTIKGLPSPYGMYKSSRHLGTFRKFFSGGSHRSIYHQGSSLYSPTKSTVGGA